MPRQLDRLFRPKTIALVGGSPKADRPGYQLVQQLLAGGFEGEVYVVNPKYEEVQGLPCYSRLDQAPVPPDLAVVCTPYKYFEQLAEKAGQLQVAGMLFLTGGPEDDRAAKNDLYASLVRIGRQYQMHILGPNTIGLILPHLFVRATLSDIPVQKGHLALITQSGALGLSILDWAAERRIGFSCFASVGAAVDLTFGDLIDYLGTDGHTACILLYVEELRQVRRFMSAARAFARSKPILVLKSGASQMTHVQQLENLRIPIERALAYQAAFKRAGMLEVEMIGQLFNCAQALATQPRPLGPSLAVVSNAAGPGLLATDYLSRQGVTPFRPSERLLQALTEGGIVHRITGPALTLSRAGGPEDYRQALTHCLASDEVDGVLAIYAPQIQGDSLATAQVVSDVAKQTSKPILASWMGEAHVEAARELFEESSIPNYRFPEEAADTFLRIYHYHRNLEMIQETPPAIPLEQHFFQQTVQEIFDRARQNHQLRLSEAETRRVLQAYDIPANEFKVVRSSLEAIEFAESVGFPVVLKISSPEIVNKLEIGAARLNINTAIEIQEAFETIYANARQHHPDANIQGILVERMIPISFELLLAGYHDPTFGPMLLFGRGGRAAEFDPDIYMGLPPLNMALVRHLVERTRIYQQLKGSNTASFEALYTVIVRFSYLLVDFPEISEISINPLLLDGDGVLVLDANIRLDALQRSDANARSEHLAISPYPAHLRTERTLRDGREIVLRPIRPEDEPLVQEMLEQSSAESLRARFFGQTPKVDHHFLSRFTQIDYDREIAIVALTEAEKGRFEMMGVVRLVGDAWREGAEYAIFVADPYQRLGLGRLLTEYILEVAKEMNIGRVYATVLSTNKGMVHLFRAFNFELEREDFSTFFVEKVIS